MTRNNPRSIALRTFMALTPALLVTGVAVALVGGGRATEASAGAMLPAAPSPACLTDDLSGTVTGHGGDRVREAVLSLTNTADHACRIPGWADVALVTPPGEVVRVPTTEIGTAGPAIVLEPGATASSSLQWDTCAAGRKGCGTGVAFQFIVDADSTGTAADVAELPEADGPGITMKALRIGPLQAQA
ncbi:hypothetical protein Q0Z83_065940 [Actinoplanes sichuanensis]|uniref:DUF4232 domain-containing protein n=1 Tax=Actinoplanes sichuanensis TaxID=512349 RepID=A0ABW4AN68_9ACTN|nr:DUF4232 domain-containing protein [Actinoplanes sichuanensis]BEL08403.1 hypothetical protein Q0Z83_065940 [Actinoplanes sichuanensis]